MSLAYPPPDSPSHSHSFLEQVWALCSLSRKLTALLVSLLPWTSRSLIFISLSPPLGTFTIQWFFPLRSVSLSSLLCWPLYSPFPGQLPVKSWLKSSLWSPPYPANCPSSSLSSGEVIKTLNCTSFAFPVSPMHANYFNLSMTSLFSSIKWRYNRVVTRIKTSCAKQSFAWDICFQ